MAFKRSRDDFELHERLGEGSFGVVRAAKEKKTSTLLAIKQIKHDPREDGIQITAVREIAILRRLQHDHIVRLLSTTMDDDNVWLVFEHCDMDLKNYMQGHSNMRIPLTEVRLFCRHLLSGIAYCHRLHLVHRDIKPQNLLIKCVSDATKLLKVADFGLTRHLPHAQGMWQTYTPQVVTLWYRPPELVLGLELYNPYAVDVWSIGCVLAELSAGRPMARGDSEIGQLYKIFQLLGTPTLSSWPRVGELKHWTDSFPSWRGACLATKYARIEAHGVSLLRDLLRYDVEKRICVADALKHPFLATTSTNETASG